MDDKRDLHIQRGAHHGIHDIHPMDQKGDTFPFPEMKNSGISGRSEKMKKSYDGIILSSSQPPPSDTPYCILQMHQ